MQAPLWPASNLHNLGEMTRHTPEPKSTRLNMVVEPSLIDRIDAWRSKQRPIPSRSEAIREMVKTMLDIVEKDRG